MSASAASAAQLRVVRRLARLEAAVLEQHQHLPRRRGRRRAPRPRPRPPARWRPGCRAARRGAAAPAPSRARGPLPSAARGGRPAPSRRRARAVARASAAPRGSGCRRRPAVVERHVEVDPTRRAAPSAADACLRRASASRGGRLEDLGRSSTQPVRVAPLVVVPGDRLDHRAVHDHRGAGVEDRRVRVADDVRRDDRLLGVGEDPFQRAAAAAFDRGVDLLDGARLLAGAGRGRPASPSGSARGWRSRSSLPFSSGSTRPTALAAPVEVGIMLSAAARAGAGPCAACPQVAGRWCRRGSWSSGRARCRTRR